MPSGNEAFAISSILRRISLWLRTSTLGSTSRGWIGESWSLGPPVAAGEIHCMLFIAIDVMIWLTLKDGRSLCWLKLRYSLVTDTGSVDPIWSSARASSASDCDTRRHFAKSRLGSWRSQHCGAGLISIVALKLCNCQAQDPRQRQGPCSGSLYFA